MNREEKPNSKKQEQCGQEVGKRIDDFYDAWGFLADHPMFKAEGESRFAMGHFERCLDIAVVKVNPVTDVIEDDAALNTKTAVWLECGPYSQDIPIHDIALDCGGDTFESAIITLARLVHQHYGDYSIPPITQEERDEMNDFLKKLRQKRDGQ